MNPFSLPVLAGAALVTSPALWRSVVGEARLDLALSRYLVAVLLCWAALSLFTVVVGPTPTPAPAAREGEGSDDPKRDGTARTN